MDRKDDRAPNQLYKCLFSMAPRASYFYSESLSTFKLEMPTVFIFVNVPHEPRRGNRNLVFTAFKATLSLGTGGSGGSLSFFAAHH